MRIIHWDVSFLHGGSVSRAVLGLAQHQVRLGADVAVAAARPSGPPRYGPIDTSGGLSIFEWQPRWTLRVNGFLLRGVPPGVRRRLRAFRPDVVHVHGGFNPDNLWAPRLFGCPIVFSPHGAYFSEVFRKGRQAAKTLYLQVERQMLLRNVAAVHVLSPIEGTSVRGLLPRGKVYCLPQGPGIPMPRLVEPEVLEARNDVVTLVHVGRLDVFNKGLDILLAAFAAAAKRVDGRGIRLILVGSDFRGGMAWLKRRGLELGIADRVVFAGVISDSQVIATLNRSDIYVQASRYEAFGLSAAEALLVGKPAILSNAVGLASYPQIESLPHVRVVRVSVPETAEAIVDFVRRLDDLTSAAGQHRTALSTFFSWEEVAGSQLAMYERVRAAGMLRGGSIAGLAGPQAEQHRRQPPC